MFEFNLLIHAGCNQWVYQCRNDRAGGVRKMNVSLELFPEIINTPLLPLLDRLSYYPQLSTPPITDINVFISQPKPEQMDQYWIISNNQTDCNLILIIIIINLPQFFDCEYLTCHVLFCLNRHLFFCNTVQYSTVQYSTVKYNTVQCMASRTK